MRPKLSAPVRDESSPIRTVDVRWTVIRLARLRVSASHHCARSSGPRAMPPPVTDGYISDAPAASSTSPRWTSARARRLMSPSVSWYVTSGDGTPGMASTRPDPSLRIAA